MTRILVVALCLLGLAGTALAQTSSTTSSSTLPTSPPYTGLEGFLYGTMTPSQQSTYNTLQTIVNLQTQLLTAAQYQEASKAFSQGDVLNAYQQMILSRGPLPVTSGNASFVPVGTTSSTSGSTSTGSSSSTSSSTTTGTTSSTTGSSTNGSTGTSLTTIPSSLITGS